MKHVRWRKAPKYAETNVCDGRRGSRVCVKCVSQCIGTNESVRTLSISSAFSVASFFRTRSTDAEVCSFVNFSRIVDAVKSDSTKFRVNMSTSGVRARHTSQGLLEPAQRLKRRRASVEGFHVLLVQFQCLVAICYYALVLWWAHVHITCATGHQSFCPDPTRQQNTNMQHGCCSTQAPVLDSAQWLLCSTPPPACIPSSGTRCYPWP